MNTDKISEALEVLEWFSDRMANLPEHREDAIQLSLHCSILQMALGDLALRLLKGEDPYEALCAVATGEKQIDQSKVDLLRAIWPPVSKE